MKLLIMASVLICQVKNKRDYFVLKNHLGGDPRLIFSTEAQEDVLTVRIATLTVPEIKTILEDRGFKKSGG